MAIRSLKPWFWTAAILLIILVFVAIGKSPLYRGFVGGEFLADLTVQEVKTEMAGSLLNITVVVAHEGEPIRREFFIVGAKALLTGGSDEPVWNENIAINTSGKGTEKTYVANFIAPLPFGDYDLAVEVDMTNLIDEQNERNNTATQKVTIDLSS